MELAGVIIAVIVAALLLYLIPSLLGVRTVDDAATQDLSFGSTMRTIHVANESLDIDESLFVSTPYTRRSQFRDIRRHEQRTAAFRRWALLGIIAGIILAAATSLAGFTPWWVLGIPLGLLGAFIGIVRMSVRVVKKQKKQRIHDIRYGDDMNDTICFAAIRAEAEREVELTAPIEFSGSLWDPVPVTMPTYVQKPLASRTVRTIDLSAPVVAAAHPFPPTADAQIPVEAAPSAQLQPNEDTGEITLRKASGQ
ncbi:MAG: hypothetical protein ACRDAX_07590 [Propionibacteriaceae bacterium]